MSLFKINHSSPVHKLYTNLSIFKKKLNKILVLSGIFCVTFLAFLDQPTSKNILLITFTDIKLN